MSDTPRTDAAEVRMERLDGDFDHVVAADFTRTLERELAAATARAESAERTALERAIAIVVNAPNRYTAEARIRDQIPKERT